MNNLAKHMMDSGRISIVIADDHPLMRKAIRVTLESEPDFAVIGEAKDGEELVGMVREVLPNVIIMDIAMPKLNGLEATRRIKAQQPNIAVLVLTVHDDTEHILGMLEAGAAGYLTKDVSDQDLINAIRATVSGETVIETPVFHEVLRFALQRRAKPKSPAIIENGEKLSAQDLQILKLAASGMTNQAIATKLGLSPFTVKNYMAEIFSKLNVASRTEAAIIALRAGLLNIEDF